MNEVVVTGARSQIGLFLLPRLERVGYSVQAVSRAAPPDPEGPGEGVRWIRPEDGADQARFLVSCGPLGLARRFLERPGPVEKVVVFSTTSVLTKRASRDRRERAQIEAIAADERVLNDICLERGIDLVLLRPTLVYGCGLDRNVSLLLKLGERGGFIPVSTRAGGLRQPVHAEDLAQLAADCLSADTGRFLDFTAPGGEALSYREMVERVVRCGRRPVRLLPLPPALLAALVRLASLTGPGKGVNPEMVRRQSLDLVFEPTNLPPTIGWNPRPFRPVTADFHIPPELERYREPGSE